MVLKYMTFVNASTNYECTIEVICKCESKLQVPVQCQRIIYMGADKSLARPGMKQSTLPRILWNLEVHYHIHNSPPPVPTLTKSIHSSAHHTFGRLMYRGADKSLARPGRKQAISPAFYGTWRFITTLTRVQHLSLP